MPTVFDNYQTQVAVRQKNCQFYHWTLWKPGWWQQRDQADDHPWSFGHSGAGEVSKIKLDKKILTFSVFSFRKNMTDRDLCPNQIRYYGFLRDSHKLLKPSGYLSTLLLRHVSRKLWEHWCKMAERGERLRKKYWLVCDRQVKHHSQAPVMLVGTKVRGLTISYIHWGLLEIEPPIPEERSERWWVRVGKVERDE